MAKTNNTVDLSAVLSQEVNVPAMPSFNIDDEDLNNPVDLDPEIETAEQVTYEEPINEGYMPPQHLAETIVNLLDGLQSNLIPYLLKGRKFTDRELEVLQTLDTSGGTIYPENSPENRILQKWNQHKEVINKIPFTDGEKARLIAATARYAETTEMKVSPFTGLMMAYSEVVLNRSAYFFTE